MGAMPAEGTYLLIARVATVYYFIHFLVILPLLNIIETPRALPKSVSDPIFSSASSGMAPATPRDKK